MKRAARRFHRQADITRDIRINAVDVADVVIAISRAHSAVPNCLGAELRGRGEEVHTGDFER